MKIVSLRSVTSTNSWVASNSENLEGEVLVYSHEQTAGRGQRGNSWEAEPGKNLTASMLLYPVGIRAARQFVISEAVSLAVTDLLSELGVEAKVKWPNDIYVEDRKICGILIEHSIMGRGITRTIAGVGLNLNQEVFLSDAPNPVSVVQLTGCLTDVDEAAAKLAGATTRRITMAMEAPDEIHSRFLSSLWRGDGKFYPFIDKASGRCFQGRISGIESDGHLHLMDEEDRERIYAFKEVEFCLY